MCGKISENSFLVKGYHSDLIPTNAHDHRDDSLCVLRRFPLSLFFSALKSDTPQQWQRSLAALQTKVKAKLPEHAPLMLGEEKKHRTTPETSSTALPRDK